MTDASHPPLVVRPHDDGSYWTAYLEQVPQFAICGPTAVQAVRRFLEAAESGPGTYSVMDISDTEHTAGIPLAVIWDPPELLVRCPDCEGRGEYVGLFVVESCRVCSGRSLVPA